MEVEKRDGATRSAVLGTRKPSAWPACLPACPVCLPASLPVSQPASQPASHPKFPSSNELNCRESLTKSTSSWKPRTRSRVADSFILRVS
ncbi:uncharacterized protein LOC114928115 isoform X2 [Nylanderia fulva]|uniref:uncharacterized protein LOC114928115 isoform X2 n=1 Tax=Nylanderia fulva TaxID=613905 RepID=UPI0010FB2064|nr:uncharacterized protein LOC114928115 isoform X2 [Nylanderia fulva]